MEKTHINLEFVQKLYDKNLGNRALQGLLGAVLDGNIDTQTLEQNPIWKEAKFQYGEKLETANHEYLLQKKQKEIAQLRIDQQYIHDQIDILKDALEREAKQYFTNLVETNIKMRGANIFSQQFENLTKDECHHKIREYYDFLGLL